MNYKTKLNNIKAMVFDVDGVFTDGGVIALDNGDLLRKHNSKDGFAVRYAIENGLKIGIITGGASLSIKTRFIQLGVLESDIYLKSRDKIVDFNDYLKRNNLDACEILYMGDDMPDIPVMKLVGLSCCPKDAVQEVIEVSQYVSTKIGGDGCVRDVIEQILKINGLWNRVSTPTD